jgi:hypothetical protein
MLMPVWCGRPARIFARIQWRDHTQIDGPHVTAARRKRSPSSQRILKAFQIKRTRKIVSTATRHNQDGKLQLDQLRQITVPGPVSAKDENRIRLA